MGHRQWRSTTLGNLGEFRNGVNFNRHHEGRGIPILKVKDFGDRTFVPDQGLDELDSHKIEIAPSQLLGPGDTVIIRSNGNSQLVGRSLFFRGRKTPLAFSGFCIRFRPEASKIDPLYAAYFIRSPFCRQRFTAYGSGTGIQNLSQGILSDVPIDLPSMAEQRAIARILGGLDDKIELNRRMNETLEAMARALFKSWFVDFDPVRAKAEGRSPAEASAKAGQPPGMDAETAALFSDRFEDSPLGRIPKGWRAAEISDLLTVERDSVNPAERPVEEFDHYSIPAFDEGQLPHAETGSQIKSNKILVPNNAVLLSRLNPRIPRVWLPAVSRERRSICSTEFLVAVPQSGCTREFLYGLFSSQSFMDSFTTMVTGTSGSHQRVKSESLLRMRVPQPTRNLIGHFTVSVGPLLVQIANNRAESRTLAALRDGLLPKLLSGEIRVGHIAQTQERIQC